MTFPRCQFGRRDRHRSKALKAELRKVLLWLRLPTQTLRFACKTSRTGVYIPHRLASSSTRYLIFPNQRLTSSVYSMGSSDPPYLYDPRPNRPISYPYSQFDPKAVSRASWQPSTTSSRPQSARDGPLIDFNRHPDSYMVVRGHQRDLPTLPANIKSSVAAVRWTQLSLRALQLLAAMATLFCGIVLKPPEQTQSWIMRITVCRGHSEAAFA